MPSVLANKQVVQYELSQLQVKLEALRRQMAMQSDTEQIEMRTLSQLEHKIVSLSQKMAAKKNEMTQLSKYLGELKEKESHLLTQQKMKKSELINLIKTTYMMGRQKQLKLILNQHNPSEISRAMSIFGYLSKNQITTIQQLQVHQQSLAITQQKLQQSYIQLEQITHQLAQNKQNIKSLRNERRQQLAALRKNQKMTGQLYRVAREREATLRRLIATIVSVQHTQLPATSSLVGKPPYTKKYESSIIKTFQQNKGKMALPVTGKLIAKYGQRRKESGVKWQGLLIKSNHGTRVNAIYSGQIVFADWFRGFGQLIIIDHGAGYMSLYANNSILHSKQGDIVEKNQQIAAVGNTGGLDLPGLYFEIRHNGKPDDPLKWCKT